MKPRRGEGVFYCLQEQESMHLYQLILSFTNLWKQPTHSGHSLWICIPPPPCVCLNSCHNRIFNTLSRLWSPHTLNRCRCSPLPPNPPPPPCQRGQAAECVPFSRMCPLWKISRIVVVVNENGELWDGIKVDQSAERNVPLTASCKFITFKWFQQRQITWQTCTFHTMQMQTQTHTHTHPPQLQRYGCK